MKLILYSLLQIGPWEEITTCLVIKARQVTRMVHAWLLTIFEDKSMSKKSGQTIRWFLK